MNDNKDLPYLYSDDDEEEQDAAKFHSMEQPLDIGEKRVEMKDENVSSSKKQSRFFRRCSLSIMSYCKKHWRLIYWLPLVFFVIFALLIGENNLYHQIKLSRRIYQLEKKIEAAEEKYRTNKEYLDSRLRDNFYDIEALARKNYGFKEEGEKVFLLIDTTAHSFKEENTIAQ